MRRILQVKLLMDQRRVPTIFSQSAKKSEDATKDKNHFLRSLWMYALLGIFLIPFILLGDNYVFQMSIVFAVMMFIVMTSMISDFSSVLLDIRDKNILHTKPVNQRTISFAKTIHIFIYMFFLTASITALPLIVGLANHGFLFFFIFLVGIILLDLLIVFLTALIYFLILKFFDGEKLKDIINYVQIGLSLAMIVGYQLVARAFEFVDFQFVFDPKWWQFLIPPVWYGALFEWLLHGEANLYFGAFSMLAVIVPLLSIVVYIKLMPAFEKNLQKLSDHGGASNKARRRGKLSLANLACTDKEERAFFRFASHMMKNEREFKLKVYPSLGFSVIFPFIFLFSQLRMQTFAELAASKWYLSIYFCMIMIPTVVMMLKHSGKYKGAWIFKTAPVNDPTPIFKGTLKAFLVKLFLPIDVVLSISYILIFGWRIIPELIIVLLSSFLFTVICYKFIGGSLPFSKPFDAVEQNGIKLIPFFIIIGLFIVVHIISSMIPFGAYGYIVILLLANGIVWRTAFKVSWESV
ncbi:hypothetical protein [Tuberibacillus sp. Marseille-P3662]|uniref:hypothetical protein n=1 Tax=Tuberibacillus sp. Marseille-P3662 TaxID=1965358 RepID=UPI0034E8FB67